MAPVITATPTANPIAVPRPGRNSSRKMTVTTRRATPLRMNNLAAVRTSSQSCAKAIVPHHTDQPRNQAAIIRASSGLSSHGQRVAANSGLMTSRRPFIRSRPVTRTRNRLNQGLSGPPEIGAGADIVPRGMR